MDDSLKGRTRSTCAITSSFNVIKDKSVWKFAESNTNTHTQRQRKEYKLLVGGKTLSTEFDEGNLSPFPFAYYFFPHAGEKKEKVS